MNITSALRTFFLAAALWVSAQAQITDPLREASLIDNMLCRGDYLEALKLTKRDFLYAKVNSVPLAPYVGALFIETGKLEAADRVLNPQPVNSGDQGSRSALLRERAALLLARGEYKLGAAEAVQAYRFSISDSIYKSRRAYAGSIAAESLLRSGDLNGARGYADQSLKTVQKQTRATFFFVPRVFYAACLIASYGSSPQTAEPICLHGLALAKRSPKPRRDLTLGYLALAEAQLKNGEFDASREAANRSLTLTNALFGPVHQDAVEALELISLADLQKGNRAEARREAQRALEIAKKLFGPDSKRVAELTQTFERVSY